MTRLEKILAQVLDGRSDAQIAFRDLQRLLKRSGFAERIRGDHHIFAKANVAEIINLQPRGAKAKPYQVRQVRKLIQRYRLGGGGDGE